MHKLIATFGLTALMGTAYAQTAPVDQYIESAFQAMDTNGDRQITHSEFAAFMHGRIQAQRATFEAGFAAADVNGDGFIDKNEAEINDQLSANFEAIDVNSDGRISREELGAALIAVMQAEAQAAGAAAPSR